MYCTPTVCWVQPTLYTKAVVRSRPEFSVSSSQTRRKGPAGTPHICSTISGVYRAKWRLRIWKTHRGCCSVSSRSGFPAPTSAPPEPCASPRAACRIDASRARSSYWRSRSPDAACTSSPSYCQLWGS